MNLSQNARRWMAPTAAASIVALACGVGPAAAGPTRVKIEVRTPQGGHPGTFTTSGGGLCPRGTTKDKFFARPTAANGWKVRLRKTFRCSDRSGTFGVELRAQVAGEHASGTWKIVAGSGAYAGLAGAGTLATKVLPGTFVDHLAGSITRG